MGSLIICTFNPILLWESSQDLNWLGGCSVHVGNEQCVQHFRHGNEWVEITQCRYRQEYIKIYLTETGNGVMDRIQLSKLISSEL